MSYDFDGVTNVISLSEVTNLDVRDLYSRWKDWVLMGDNSKYFRAFDDVVGGNPIDLREGIYVTSYFFLINGWKIRPQEKNHKLRVYNGVLLSDSGDPFISTLGNYNVLIQYSQPIKSETISTGGGSGGLTMEEHDKLMSLPTITSIKSSIRNEVIEILRSDPSIELSSIPNTSAPLDKQIQFLFQYFRNKRTVTNTSETMFKENAVTPLGTSTLTDDGTTFTKNEMA